MKYIITLKSGVSKEVTSTEGRDITGLWIWMNRQMTPQFLNFQECTVKASDIAMIENISELDAQ